MRSPSTIGIDNNLSSCESSISLRTSHDKAARGVNDDIGVLQEFSRANFLDDLLNKGILDLLVRDIRVMLSGDEDIVNSDWLDIISLVGIFYNDLGFKVRSQPGDGSTVSGFTDLLADQISQVVGVGVKDHLVPLISSITEH